MITFLRFIVMGVSGITSGILLSALYLILFIVIASAQNMHGSPDLIFLPIVFGIMTIVVLGVLAASPVGDQLAKLFFSVRKQSLREEEKLKPALAEAKAAYKQKHNEDLNIRILVMDLPNINGIALGQQTIAVSTGLLKTANEEELTAILSHEIGHLHHGDGSFNLAIAATTAPIIMLVNLVTKIFFGANESKTLKSMTKEAGEYGSSCWSIFQLLLSMACLVPIIASLPALLLLRLFNFLTDWQLEYRADKFVGELGYGAGLISLFERIEDEDVRGAEGFMKKYIYSHPPTALRIDRLERMMGVDTKEAA